MKVTDSGQSTPVQPAVTVKTEKPAGTQAEPRKSSTASRSASDNAQRIQSLFARAGIGHNMILPDEAARQQAIKRRNDILALSRIKNLQAIMDVALSVSLTETSNEPVDPDWFYAFSLHF